MTLPIDRSNLTAAQTNQVPGLLIQSAKNIAALQTPYDTIDELYNYTTGLVSASTLSRLGIINVKDYNASGLATTFIGSITSGSKVLTLTATPDFVQGQGINLQGAFEASSLQVTAPATVSSNVTVTLNGVAFLVAVVNGDTAIQVATKIRAATYAGWTAGGTAGTDTVTFTSTTSGVKTDSAYSAGATGATGTMTTTTQGTADQISTVSSVSGLVVNIADNATRTITAGTISHDDTIAIQNAVNALKSAGGGTLVIPFGTYLHGTVITFSGMSNFSIIAYGSTVKSANSTAVASGYGGFYFTNCSNFNVKDLKIDGNRANRTPIELPAHLYYIEKCSNFAFMNCQAINGVCDGFYLGATNDNDTTTYSTNGIIINPYVTNCYRNGISIINAFDVKIFGGQIDTSNGTAPQAGVDIEPNVTSLVPGCKNIKIIGLSVKNCLGSGITFTALVEDIVIQNCDIDNCKVNPLYAGGNNCIVDNNTIRNITSSTRGSIDIPSGVRNVIVKNNILDNIQTGQPGIYSHSTASDVSITGNQLRKINDTLSNLGYAIQTSTLKIQILQNFIDTCGSIGIYADGNYANISNNTIVKPTDRGIYAAGNHQRVAFNHIEDMTVLDDTTGFLAIVGADGVVIGNTVLKTVSSSTNWAIRCYAQPKMFAFNTATGFTGANSIVYSGASDAANTMTAFHGFNSTDNANFDQADIFRYKQNGKVRIGGTAAPASGTWAVGDIVYNTAPASAGFIGWVCTVAGTPGTWKTFGLIS